MLKICRRKAIVGAILTLASATLWRKIMTDTKSSKERMPILFIGHGSPMNAIEKNEFTESLSKLSSALPRPKAVLMISAHWETEGTWVTGMNNPKTIHDFYGFPKPLFDVQYPAPGDSSLAIDISSSVRDFKIEIDKNNWGLDHGTWSVLRHIYPEADVPVIQLSLDKTKSIEYHFELGQKIKYLRDNGVMIIGSGNIVHNLGELNWGENAKPHEWAIEFDEWVKGKLVERNFNSLVTDPLKSREGKLSIPTLEHYLPLLYVLGASGKDDKLLFDYEGIQNSSISMRCLRLT
jgi:4,5-DOPA dioxygenase extradiol|tara:strand:- start:6332 stop:7207 length:876 start_codon:yes stop_codon:yes gene_type:complete